MNTIRKNSRPIEFIDHSPWQIFSRRFPEPVLSRIVTIDRNSFQIIACGLPDPDSLGECLLAARKNLPSKFLIARVFAETIFRMACHNNGGDIARWTSGIKYLSVLLFEI
jgi:hypothetical protein